MIQLPSASRREFHLLALALPWLGYRSDGRKVTTTAGGEPHFVDPPGEPSAELRERIVAIETALVAGATTLDEVLAEPSSNELRPFTEFRALVGRHARTGSARLVPKDEIGTPLCVELQVLDRNERPYGGVRVHAYQTSAKGWYAAEAPHVSGMEGDTRFARLFTSGLTDERGILELVSIRPGPYPRSDLPSHIHVLLEGRERDIRVTEIRFEDCPRMTPDAHEESLRSGFVVVPVEVGSSGARCRAVFRLPQAD